jgi:hypothetical protein
MTSATAFAHDILYRGVSQVHLDEIIANIPVVESVLGLVREELVQVLAGHWDQPHSPEKFGDRLTEPGGCR